MTVHDRPAACLFDLDGTLYTEAGPIPGAVEALAELRRRGVPFRCVTNTTRWANPFSRVSWRKSSWVQRAIRAALNRRGSSGSTWKAAAPANSGREVVLLVTTGVPQAIASRMGRPKPS